MTLKVYRISDRAIFGCFIVLEDSKQSFLFKNRLPLTSLLVVTSISCIHVDTCIL